jgi:N-acetylmuramoyl-L-alanine amidase
MKTLLAIFAVSMLANVFAVTTTTSDILARYQSATSTVKILIIPGHDNDYSGTEFKNIKEADLNLKLGKALAPLLLQDKKLEVILARDPATGDYNDELTTYMSQEKSSINYFIRLKRQQMANFLSRGQVKKNVTIDHNSAVSDVAFRLYALNKWSNENKIDIMVHLHLNDDPARNLKTGLPGRYNGFVIFVPERQYGNAAASRDLATVLASKLNQYSATSTNPFEKEGIVEAQELIALGSNGSQNGASVLIESAYIYASNNADKLAKLIAQGLQDYLAGR